MNVRNGPLWTGALEAAQHFWFRSCKTGLVTWPGTEQRKERSS